jgi:molybdate transport system substrate-binding protein
VTAARAAFALLFALMMTPANAAEVLLHAAGSLRGALTDMSRAFEAASGNKVVAKYGPSGTLKDAIANGERAEVFASANMEHPQALSAAVRAQSALRTGEARPGGDTGHSSRHDAAR